ncbi:hypothetical protein IWW34DRAFT_752991 [Fusarium oxysporum f. sp. albedinis]|nr:hypothetical protein IWW34DRAFT_752991 [Fusarium oxysporum f. sp. albedinis]KAK2471108.1 hypothetical protein H9L39_17339 [Fusarium oxysporum f. sp. albedinis]
MQSSNILAWLDNIQLPSNEPPAWDDTEKEPSAKRVKLSRGKTDVSISRLPTPPLDMPASNKKRPRPSDDESDDDQDDATVFSQPDPDPTPKAKQFRDRLHKNKETFSGSPSRSSSTSQHSSISNASSPTKQQRNASLQETGYKSFSFTNHPDWQPEQLTKLRMELEKINNGEKIISDEIKSQFDGCNIPNFAFFDKDNPPATANWRYPDADFVDDILERAALCLDEGEGESSWNVDVHAPILRWIFPSRPQSKLLHYRYCPSATIVPGFKPQNAPSQMVDFCIVVRPQEDTPAQAIIDDLCNYRPDKTINHTDWGNLSKDPIAISIETKKHGENWTKAVHQMGTWHSAQWRSLYYDRKGIPFSGITFLPGIIVQGHKWMFVATVRHDGKAVLFQNVAIGDTETKFGIFKLLVSLQCLHRWIEREYWPAFQKDILEMNGS